MDTRQPDPPDETDELLPRAATGDTVALAALFARHRIIERCGKKWNTRLVLRL
jgi:hypothetical protein